MGSAGHEAAAYAEFRGKSLPTVYHWDQGRRAPGPPRAYRRSAITPGLRPVGQSTAVSPSGLHFDMAGNVPGMVLERNAGRRRARYILGGAWNDARIHVHLSGGRSAFDRSSTNGIRLAKYLTPKSVPAVGPAHRTADAELPRRGSGVRRCVSGLHEALRLRRPAPRSEGRYRRHLWVSGARRRSRSAPPMARTGSRRTCLFQRGEATISNGRVGRVRGCFERERHGAGY